MAVLPALERHRAGAEIEQGDCRLRTGDEHQAALGGAIGKCYVLVDLIAREVLDDPFGASRSGQELQCRIAGVHEDMGENLALDAGEKSFASLSGDQSADVIRA